MADKPGENQPGDKVSRSDHRADEKAGSPELHKARNANAEDVAKASKPHLGDGSLRRFNQAHLDSQNESLEIDFGGHVASRKSQLNERQASAQQSHVRDAQSPGSQRPGESHGPHAANDAHATSDGHDNRRQIHLSQSARPEHALHLIDVTMSTTAQVLAMPFLHLTENNAINKDIANFIEHFRHDPNQFNKDAAKVGSEILGILDKPMSEDERARMVGMLIPLFFLPGSKTPLDANKVKAMELEKMTGTELAEAGITRRVMKVYRGDNYAYEALDKTKAAKSHLTASGDLVPASTKGIYNGRVVDVVDHINPLLDPGAKGFSPYTSFSEKSKEVALTFGKTHITLDLDALRRDIASGIAKDVQIIDQADMEAQIHLCKDKGDLPKLHALECARAEHEVLVKGVIPAKYLKVEVK